jgi:hypothetical protein
MWTLRQWTARAERTTATTPQQMELAAEQKRRTWVEAE